jgi:MFS family permease
MAMGELGGAPAAFALGGALLVGVAVTPAMKVLPLEFDDWGWALLWMGSVLMPVLLVMLALREPVRSERVVAKPSLRVAWPELWRYRSVALPLQLARATLFIADGAIFVWAAPFFARHFHMPADKTGATVGAILLAAGLLGPALGGPLVDYCQRHGGPRRTIAIAAGVALLSVPLALFGFTSNLTLASVLMGLFLVLGFAISAMSLALTLIVIPGELRGLNLGISIVVGALFFIGLAPLAISGLSNLLGGEDMIGEALTIVCAVASLMNAVVLAFSGRHFPTSTATNATLV